METASLVVGGVIGLLAAAVVILILLLARKTASARRERNSSRGPEAFAAYAPEIFISGDEDWAEQWDELTAFLRERFGAVKIEQYRFNTHAGDKAPPERLAAARAARHFVALVCEGFVKSPVAMQLRKARRGAEGRSHLLAVDKAVLKPPVRRRVERLQSILESGPYGRLFDPQEPDRLKRAEAFRRELTRVFGERPDSKPRGKAQEAGAEGRAYKYDYFISYNRQWSAYADEIKAFLSARDGEATIFLDRDELDRIGAQLSEELPAGVAASRHMISLVCSRYLASEYCIDEVRYFNNSRFAKDRDQRHLYSFLMEPIEEQLKASPAAEIQLIKDTTFATLYDPSGAAHDLDTKELALEIETAFNGHGIRSPFPPPFDDAVPEVANFMGRESELARIAIALQLQPEFEGAAPSTAMDLPATTLRAIIHAGKGFGKTSLAARFARRLKGKIGVWWVRSENASILLGGVEAISKTLDPAIAASEERAKFAISSRFGGTRVPFLIVFDNVTVETRDLVGRLCAVMPNNVRVLMTGHTEIGLDAFSVPLDVLDLETAAAVLQARAGRDDTDGAIALARALGALPLALEHAGAYCRATNRPFAYYLKSLPALVRRAPPGSSDKDATVFATILASLNHAVADAGDNGNNVQALMDFICYCAAESIPMTLLESAVDDGFALDGAVHSLHSVGLLGAGQQFADHDTSITSHRFVQELLRVDVDASGRSGRVVNRLLPALCRLLAVDEAAPGKARSALQELAFQKYFPHFLGALPHLDSEDFRGGDAGADGEADIFDRIAKLVVLKLHEDASIDTADRDDARLWRHLPKLLGCYYEVGGLAHPLNAIIARLAGKPGQWAAFRDACLTQENYVLRFALAEALASAVRPEEPDSESGGLQTDDITQLLLREDSLNHFELGGYAFKSVASLDPDFAVKRPDLLRRLANHRCYPGRSILGDLGLNLAFRGVKVSKLMPEADGFASFWHPCWDFVAYDVEAIRAAEIEMCGAPAPEIMSDALHEELAYIATLKLWQTEARAAAAGHPGLESVIDDYFRIGNDTQRIEDETEAFAALAHAGALGPLLKLFFGHPLWSVAEAAADVVSDLHRTAADAGDESLAHALICAVRDLFDPALPWRVRYGACEAAFQMRTSESPRSALFHESVRRFYADPNAKLRGLCAENLLSTMLNQRDRDRLALETAFSQEISRWISDEDCWVLEHVHRYMHTLHQRGQNRPAENGAPNGVGSHFVSAQASRLAVHLGEWWAVDRQTFLSEIETAKRNLIAAGNH